MIQALTFAISVELRHVFDECRITDHCSENSEKFFKILRRKLKFNLRVYKKDLVGAIAKERLDSPRTRAYKATRNVVKALGLTDLEFATIAKRAFYDFRWTSGYGGTAWGRIAEALMHLLESKTIEEKATWIDHAYDLQHNNYTVFDKLYTYSRPISNTGQPHRWLISALDWKKEVIDIREFYFKVSPELRPAVARAAREFHSGSIEDYIKNFVPRSIIILDEILWPGGVFKGSWFVGDWSDGIFRDGKWYDGTWKNGTWENGTWDNGVWKDGVWKAGVWKRGIWQEGIHLKGSFRKGNWNGGIWKGGSFYDGYWKNGEWYSGRWFAHPNCWEQGKIYSNKFQKLIYSVVSPPEFRNLEKKAKTLRELRKQAKTL